jgi:uncharacterized membrane protein (Fun14 family)
MLKLAVLALQSWDVTDHSNTSKLQRHVSFCSPLTNWALVFIGSLLLSNLMFQACTAQPMCISCNKQWLCTLWQVQTSNQGWFKRKIVPFEVLRKWTHTLRDFLLGFQIVTHTIGFFFLKVIISVFWRNSKCETKDKVAWAFKSVQLY